MKMKLLFVIDSLTIGGAEKSLVSLLNLIDSTRYEIDLLMFKKGGELERYLPDYINVLQIPEYFRFTDHVSFNTVKNIKFFCYRTKATINLRLNNHKKRALHSEQVIFKNIKKVLAPLQKKYDVAVAYSQGMPTYFVADKVFATKKFAWINTDYPNTLYDKEIDFESYRKFHKIVTVSNHTRNSIAKIKNDYSNKIELIKDIVDPNVIYKMAKEHKVNEFDGSVTNILTVGRLVAAKGYDIAIEAAKKLIESGYKFKWFIIGEGAERKRLQFLIDKHQLNENFILLGKKINPYTYMINCNIYVQTSIKEGFGLTVSEAKILRKPIVCTNFPTAKEIIKHNVDGLIVDTNGNSIFDGIKRYMDDIYFQKQIVNQLNSKEPYSSVNELNKFYKLMQGE